MWFGIPPEWKRRQRRMQCGYCKAEWWYTPGSMINPADHTRPNGRDCPVSLAMLRTNGALKDATNALHNGGTESGDKV
jgi:hypothetical protein